MSRLYVGNVSYETSEDTLRDAFGADSREVVSVAIIKDRDTGRAKGFAFVEMASPADAEAAITAMDGMVVDGRPLKVSPARPKRNNNNNRARY